MKNKDATKKHREKSKTRAWEQSRRDRLSECFDNLKLVLPNYEASKKLSKLDILIVAASTIKDLSEKLQVFLVSSENEKSCEPKLKVSADVIKRLEDRVKKLLIRNEQLADLLKNAGVRVPSAFGSVKRFKRIYKLSNTVTPNQAKILQKELEKENLVKPPKPPKLKKTKRIVDPKNRKNPKNTRSFKKQITNLVSPSNCVIIVSQPRIMNNSCYFVSQSPRKLNQTVITNSFLVKAPIVSSTVKPSVFSTNSALSNLVPGTLLFANNTVMPFVPTPPPLPLFPTLFTNSIQSKLPTVVSTRTKSTSTNKVSVSTGTTTATKKCSAKNLNYSPSVSKASSKESSRSSTNLPELKPKRCITWTTQINKVPIPALSSKYNYHSCLESLKTQSTDKEGNLNESKKITKSILKTPPNKRKNQEERKQESKKHKNNIVENIESLGPTVAAKPNGQSSNTKIVEVNLCSVESQNPVSEVIDGKKIEKQPKPAESIQDINESIKVSVFNMDKVGSTSINELCKSSVTTIQPLEQASNANIGSHINSVFNKDIFENTSCKEISKLNETAKCHSIKETLGNEGNAATEKINANTINKDVQTLCDQNKTGCGSLMSVELAVSNNSSTMVCGKNKFKSFEINIPQSESVAINSNTDDLKTLELNLPPSELSNDIFASFQVPPGCQNPGSTSPTAAFLLAFPLVSSGIKVTEVIGDENSQSHAGTPNLLQIGTMEMAKSTQSYSDNLTPNILNFESFSFFSNKGNCGGFYNNCSMVSTSCQTSTVSVTSSSKGSSSLGKSITIPPQIMNNGTENINSKLNTTDNLTFLSGNSSNRTDSNNAKTSNQSDFKTDIAEKQTANIKSNINIYQQPLRTAKDFELQPYGSNSYSFNKGNEFGNISSNILDINTNSFPSKISSNENYANRIMSNIPGQTSISKPSIVSTTYPNYSDRTSFVTDSTALNKSCNSVYTSAANNDYWYNSSGSGGDIINNKHFNSSNCSNFPDYRKSDYNNYDSSQVYHKGNFNQNMQPKIKPSSTQNKPINWMTSPSTTASYKPEYFLPPFTKDHNFNPNLSTNTTLTMPSNTYFSSSVFNTNDSLISAVDIRKTADLTLPSYTSYQRTDSDENQFSWSPSKIPQFLDSTHSQTFVSSTLPTLVGDLALNTTPIVEQKNTKDRNKTIQRKVGNCENQPTNFLSVSQLVEHNQEHVPGKVMSRRSSGNRSKTNTPKTKRVVNRQDINKDVPSYQKHDKVNQQKHYDISIATNLFNESKQPPRNNKNIPSSYSAEALIGNQLSTDTSAKRNGNHNKSIVPNFFSDNIVSYFPAVDVSQDNSFMQTNQGFQTNSFPQNFTTTFQNNTYAQNNFIPSACNIPSTYLPNNNFIHGSNNQDFLGENSNIFQNTNNVQAKDKNNYMKSYYRQPDRNDKNQVYNYKKAKKKSINESTLPSFDIPFLSMPGTINSPILPDDFHTTYLPPTTLYSCKNPLYSKSNSEITSSTIIPPLLAISGSKSGIQNPEMSQSANSVGTSLTNFNLSTIFPEINKGPVQENFSNTRNKDYNPVPKSFSMASSLQIPFSSKSSIPFGSFGT